MRVSASWTGDTSIVRPPITSFAQVKNSAGPLNHCLRVHLILAHSSGPLIVG